MMITMEDQVTKRDVVGMIFVDQDLPGIDVSDRINSIDISGYSALFGARE